MNIKIDKLYADAIIPVLNKNICPIRAYSLLEMWSNSGSNGEIYFNKERIDFSYPRDDGLVIPYLSRVVVGTGLKIQLPEGFGADIVTDWDIFNKTGFTVSTCSSSDSGESLVYVVNNSRKSQILRKNDIIGKLFVRQNCIYTINEVENEVSGRKASSS